MASAGGPLSGGELAALPSTAESRTTAELGGPHHLQAAFASLLTDACPLCSWEAHLWYFCSTAFDSGGSCSSALLTRRMPEAVLLLARLRLTRDVFAGRMPDKCTSEASTPKSRLRSRVRAELPTWMAQARDACLG